MADFIRIKRSELGPPPKIPPKTETFTIDEVAEMLHEMFADECACNFNGNDEWLPYVCKYGETYCPDPPDNIGCWKEFILHYKDKEKVLKEQYGE